MAGRLIGKEIDVFRDSDGSEEEIDDIALEEFDDEIDTWILEEFKKIGLDTAKSVLSVPVEDLVRRTDLEEETINEVLNILKQEFED